MRPMIVPRAKRSQAVFFLFALGALASGIVSKPAESAASWLAPGAYTAVRTDIPEFQTLFSLLRPTLDHNRVAFRGRTGYVRGFAAGSGYPQIWLRDAATIIPASRFFYTAPYLKSWLLEHLFHQKADGQLQDWLDSRGIVDKNTTETDQETSTVHAAMQVSDLVGPEWLAEAVDGRTVLDRLDRALLYVWTRKRDVSTGLIRGNHTVDWGDVEMEDPDQQAIYAGPSSHETADIYDQAQFYRAARGLALLLRARSEPSPAAQWELRAASIRADAQSRLWQEKRGFFRVHIHLAPLVHDFDEDAIFPMGGNAEAIVSGLASPAQAKRIIETAMERQREFKVSTIGGAVLPPYGKGVFRHPAVDDPYEYQNGGQWDWFAGKLVLAMFENGFAAQAAEKLREIGRKAAVNKGLFEWDTREGQGRGSSFYSGSAGSLARALFEGYFGLDLGWERLTISPRLGARPGAVHAYIPAAGRFIAYAYDFDPKTLTLTIKVNSDWAVKGQLKAALPPGLLPNRCEVRSDGKPCAFHVETAGNEARIVVETDFKNRVFKIALSKRSSPAPSIPAEKPRRQEVP